MYQGDVAPEVGIDPELDKLRQEWTLMEDRQLDPWCCGIVDDDELIANLAEKNNTQSCASSSSARQSDPASAASASASSRKGNQAKKAGTLHGAAVFWQSICPSMARRLMTHDSTGES